MRNVYYAATIKIDENQANVLNFKQKKTYKYLAEKYEKVLSPKDKIYSSDISELHENVENILKTNIKYYKTLKLTEKNANIIIALSKTLKDLKKNLFEIDVKY